MKPKMCDTDGRGGDEERRGVWPTTGQLLLEQYEVDDGITAA
jgi:hypothetical protein